mgnify:FL=1
MEQHTIIQNPNSSGQGFCHAHNTNPYHNDLATIGWWYSHTTPITAVDGSKYGIHCYRFAKSDWSIGVNARPGWRADAGKGGSGRKTPLFGSQVVRYAKRKAAELKRQG